MLSAFRRLIAIALSLVLASAQAQAHDTGQPAPPANKCEKDLVEPQDIFESDLTDPQMPMSGFTPTGLARMKQLASDLNVVTKNFNNSFEAMETQLDVMLAAFGSGQNVFMSGGPGGGKSAATMWLLVNLWVKQVHEMLTEIGLIGGQTEEGIKKGVEQINTEGSVIDAAFALLDEINNANPQLLAALLSLMNPGERFIYVNGKKVMSKLRSMVVTGNATRYEIVQMFRDRGMQSGDAFLNRNLYKFIVFNWLTLDSQERRDSVIARRNRLKSIMKYGTKAAAEKAKLALVPLETRTVDWDVLDAFAEQGFEASKDLEAAARVLANEFRKKINEEIKKSEIEAQDKKGAVVLTPSAEWTERLRSEIVRAVKYSYAIDYLRQTPAEKLEAIKGPITLTAASLWRAFAIFTTVGPGVTRLNTETMKMDWMLTRKIDDTYEPMNRDELAKETKDVRTETELRHMKVEQDQFDTLLEQVFKQFGVKKPKAGTLI